MSIKFWVLQSLIFTLAFSAAAQVSRDQAPLRKIDSVYLIVPADDLDKEASEIDDFKVKADFNTSWTTNKTRIEARAREAGANVALIKFIGWNKHNHGFYASGTLYYADSVQIKKLRASIPQEDSCSIVIFRDNGPSLATYYFDLSINGEEYRHFSDMTFIKRHVDTCDAIVRVLVENKYKHEYILGGHARYFRMITDKGNPWVANGLAVRFNGPVLQEIEDGQLGNLLIRRLKSYEAFKRR